MGRYEMMMDYLKNIQLALTLGFEEMLDENAYNGKFYIKDDQIWIHDIVALKRKLQIFSDEELRALNYDVDSYHKYVDHTNAMVDEEIAHIKALIESNDSVLSGRFDLFQEPDILHGMAGLSEEGFDDEILADYAHQMSKD
jgi:hypothetical protein